LIELMVTLAVGVILTMLALPAVQGLLERQRLTAAVEAVQAQVVLAKSESAKRSQDVSFQVAGGPAWTSTLSYVDQVSAQTFSRTLLADDYAGVQVLAPAAGSSLTLVFEPVRGTVNAGELTLASVNHQVRVAVDDVGRMTICSPTYGRYPSCSP
jgi:Tfp pilus assembly protein FimT